MNHEKPRWLDQPRNVTHLVYALYAACLTVLLAELGIDKHAHFAFENLFGFYAAFGFSAYVVIVFAAKGLRRLVRRPEQYYDTPGSQKPPR